MRRLLLLSLLVVSVFGSVQAEEFKSLEILNSTNLAVYFRDYLGFAYDSHGCLHFTPSDIYLLTKTLPNKIPLKIKKYADLDLPAGFNDLPYLAEITKNTADLANHRKIFFSSTTEVVVYPGLNHLYIVVNKKPYAKVYALAGPAEEYLMAYAINKGQPIVWDFMLTTPTDPGNYTILASADHYLSNAYYQNTIVPFGAWLVKRNNRWIFQKGRQWLKVPEHIIADLAGPETERVYNYYDLNFDGQGKIWAARWAGHDFGRDVLLWTKDGKNRYPELGYAAGELFYEQIMLVKDLVYILTIPGPDDLESCLAGNENFTYYKQLRNRKQPLLEPRMAKAVAEYNENRLPRQGLARQQALGLYQHFRFQNLVIDKQVYWYEKLKKDWDFWLELRVRLRKDFDKMGVRSLENRQNLLEQWLTDRLEFKSALPPSQAKYLQDLSFTSLFRADDENLVFSQRERDAMTKILAKAISGEGEEAFLHAVTALNDYNFGVMLDEILGDLYRSHGCLHVSPRNSYFLYSLLPQKTLIKIHGYDQKISEEKLAEVPYLAKLVNVQADLDQLKEKFKSSSDVKIAVYPASGWWIIYLKDQPFAKLSVKGGPQSQFYQVQGRDSEGRPLFEDHLAYPTTPGSFYVFKKTDHYVSNIYYPTTMIKQGGEIRSENGKWINVHPLIAEDLKKYPAQNEYSYYDAVLNASNEVVSVKWGSHPFGKYALQTSKDQKNPSPELIHSSGDLIMEERQLIKDLIKVMSAPFDRLEECAAYSGNFDLYRACADFVRDPSRDDLIELKEAVAYRFYFGLPLSTTEAAELAPDILVAGKVLKNQPLTQAEIKLLVKEGIAYYRGGQTKINMQKIMGLQFDIYQYVVTIQKYAHHYETLRKYWPELSGLRQAMLKDFNEFAIRDPKLLHNFLREMMIKRTELKTLTQEEALQLLYEMLTGSAG